MFFCSSYAKTALLHQQGMPRTMLNFGERTLPRLRLCDRVRVAEFRI